MNLDDAPESSNVEDNRGMGSKLALGGGAGGLVLLVLGLIFGVDFGGNKPGVGPGQGVANHAPLDPKMLEFTKKVLGTTEVVWTDLFRKEYRKSYTPPKLDLFTDEVRTGCGDAPSAVGPFYCPADRTVYLDPSFFDVLEKDLRGSKAEFSQAYVIAHEVGHHVQNLLGYFEGQHHARDPNDYSVRLELQADYLAGVWAHHGQEIFHFIDKGDVNEAITTANSIGDDRLQRRAGGFVHPEKFTHGTSQQRVKWFKNGLDTGDASKEKLDKFFDPKTPSRDL